MTKRAVVDLSQLDYGEFLTEFQHESDRAAAILGGVLLDEHLRVLLKSVLIDDEETLNLLERGENSPLSSFSARIKGAYCMGLISKDVFDDLETIREIRNRFAHQLHGLSFEDQSGVVEQIKRQYDGRGTYVAQTKIIQ